MKEIEIRTNYKGTREAAISGSQVPLYLQFNSSKPSTDHSEILYFFAVLMHDREPLPALGQNGMIHSNAHISNSSSSDYCHSISTILITPVIFLFTVPRRYAFPDTPFQPKRT